MTIARPDRLSNVCAAVAPEPSDESALRHVTETVTHRVVYTDPVSQRSEGSWPCRSMPWRFSRS